MTVRVLGSTVKRLSTRGDSKKTDIGRRRCLPIPRKAIPSVPFRRPLRTECDEYFRDRSISSGSARTAKGGNRGGPLQGG